MRFDILILTDNGKIYYELTIYKLKFQLTSFIETIEFDTKQEVSNYITNYLKNH